MSFVNSRILTIERFNGPVALGGLGRPAKLFFFSEHPILTQSTPDSRLFLYHLGGFGVRLLSLRRFDPPLGRRISWWLLYTLW